MLSRTLSTLTLLILFTKVNGQAGQNLGMPINTQLTSEFSPSLSGNGRTMIFQSTTGEDGQAELVMSTAKGGIWSRPETVPNLNSKTGKIQLAKDYILSYDGNTIIYSASKFGGVGGADIWMMEKQGPIWTLPINVGKPINSIGMEADPSLSPDGKFLYYIRYTDKKSPEGKPCGKIFVSEKIGKNLWKEPKELPATINTGCECSPRILADNQTLIFSSSRAGGKGGLDLYRTQLKDDGSWTTPLALTFANTNKDDVYVSVPGSGDYLYYTGPSKQGTDLFKIKIPDEFRPKKVIMIEGVIKNNQTQLPVQGRAVAYDVKKNKLISIIPTDASGSYHLFLPEGTQYDFSLNANDKTYTYYSEFINLDTISKYREQRIEGKLSVAKPNSSILLSNIAYEKNSVRLMDRSNFEIGRIQRLLQDNPQLKVEINTYTDEIISDSVKSPELTEVKIDSVEINDITDSLGIRKVKIAKTTFNNDRTQNEANAIVDALSKKGISKDRIKPKGMGDSKPLVPNTNEYNRALNRRVELVIK